MIGLRLAVQHPQLMDSLLLMATSAQSEPPQIREQTGQLWQLFRDGRREDIVDAALQFFFAPTTFLHQPDLVAKYREKILSYNQAQAEGMFEAARAVLDRKDISDRIKAIASPTLVIAGKEDLAPVPAEMALIASRIPHARLVVVDSASHLLAIEKPEQVSLIVKQFLHARQLGWLALGGHGEFRQTALDRPAHAVVGHLRAKLEHGLR
jgi:pimeloyl-ACP methyl ester carboxylesterase